MNELLLIVVIAGERVAFRAADVQSVVELDAVTPAPRAPEWIKGLSALRSRALTVIDCVRALELVHPDANAVTNQAAVVEHQGHLYALLLDQIEDVFEADATPRPVPAELSGGWRRVGLGMVETQVGVLLLVDLAALISGPDEKKAA